MAAIARLEPVTEPGSVRIGWATWKCFLPDQDPAGANEVVDDGPRDP